MRTRASAGLAWRLVVERFLRRPVSRLRRLRHQRGGAAFGDQSSRLLLTETSHRCGIPDTPIVSDCAEPSPARPGQDPPVARLGSNAPRSWVSPYAVAAESASDIAAAVNFARDKGIRLVVKGTGHDYLGRSNAADSLLVWTHNMRDVTFHPDSRPEGAGDSTPPVKALSVAAGARWLEVYKVATATRSTPKAAAAPRSGRSVASPSVAGSAASRSDSAAAPAACSRWRW